MLKTALEYLAYIATIVMFILQAPQLVYRLYIELRTWPNIREILITLLYIFSILFALTGTLIVLFAPFKYMLIGICFYFGYPVSSLVAFTLDKSPLTRGVISMNALLPIFLFLMLIITLCYNLIGRELDIIKHLTEKLLK